MSLNPPRRFLIVGSGLAGSLLARELLHLGAEVSLCSDSANPGSSRVAAGLITPITGLRFVKSWNLDRSLPVAKSVYGEIGQASGKSIFRTLPILRLFKNQEERERWQRKSDLPEMRDFLVNEWDRVPTPPGIRHEGGGIEIRDGGWVDIPALIESLHILMQNRVRFIFEPMDYRELDLRKFTVRWQGEEYDRVIFCQGYRPENPWFSWMEWKPAQGEILTLKIPGLSLNQIVNRGIFLLPLAEGLFRCGSTYNWKYLRNKPSPEGLAQLESEIRGLLSLPYEIVDHSAAIRPIFRDSLPVLGIHPQHQTVGIFNGLGSKGALTAPFLAHHFARHLLKNEPLDPGIDVARNG